MTKTEKNKIIKHLKELIEQRTITQEEQRQINIYYLKTFGRTIAAVRCGSKLKGRIIKILNEIRSEKEKEALKKKIETIKKKRLNK